MVTDEDQPIDPRELVARSSLDTTPLVSLVTDQPYCRGGITSESRTSSHAYQEFLRKARDDAQRT